MRMDVTQNNTVMVGLGPTIHEYPSLMTDCIVGASISLTQSSSANSWMVAPSATMTIE